MCTIYRKREKICNKIGITHIREINVKKKNKKIKLPLRINLFSNTHIRRGCYIVNGIKNKGRRNIIELLKMK